VEFCLKLSKMPDEKGFSYRLPTEAEWEYACRAGTTTKFSFGDDDSKLGDYAWYFKNSSLKTHPAGEKKPNAFGLYDMHGNVFEWCQDWFNVYPGDVITDPIQTRGRMKYRVIRGGGITNIASYCFSSARHNLAPDLSISTLGFRVVRISD
ncbi:formylglycine-generating enzyme family protein, partial [uncultured Gimesia sp.]|uniref:formylglycine-generating enzyme family protein n=1 Tax=uncultured Gimesia sp. TaxID=1678688 RepID=UPI00260C623F